MQLINLLVLCTALGATALPDRIHKSVNGKRDDVHNHFKNIHQLTQAKPSPDSTTTDTNSTDSSGRIPFCSETEKKAKRATSEQISYVGNTGTDDGCEWGSNMMVVNEAISDLYDYTMKLENVASEDYQVVCFNKIGPTGQIDGFWHAALTFTVAVGETKYLAAEANTQGGCAWGPEAVEKTTLGQYAGVWAEFDFANESNNNWSGGDCSSLVAAQYGLSIPGCQMCHDSTCSTIYPGGKGENAFTAGTEAQDGLGLNIPAGKVFIEAKVGYSK